MTATHTVAMFPMWPTGLASAATSTRTLSNAAICDELHLSIKTVEPLVGSVFAKLGLYLDSASNRRVLAALEYVRSAS